MMTRRYRDGRLVRSRRLRRASLQNARNLVLQRVTGMVEAVDRFALMLGALSAKERTTAVDEWPSVSIAGCSTGAGSDDTEPDGLNCDDGRGEPGTDEQRPGRKPAPCATTEPI